MCNLPKGQLLYQIDIPVHWGDMDALGHVNNIMYFRYFEQVRLQWYAAIDQGPLGETSSGMVIVDNHAEYLLPLVYPMQMIIRLGGHSAGRSSFVSTYTICVDDKLYTRGSSRIVWVDFKANKTIRMPDAIRAMVAGGSDE